MQRTFCSFFLILIFFFTVLVLPGVSLAQNGDALIDAAKRGELAKVQALLAQGVDVNSTDKNGKTALMEAARTGKNDVVKALISAGANLNAQDKDGWTAPMRAITAVQSVTLKSMVDAGADLNITNKKGKTAYQIAIEYGMADINPDLITVLNSGGAKPATSAGGESPLIFAIKAVEARTVASLLKSGADPNSKDKKGVPALVLVAAAADHKESVQMARDLLAAGADVNARDSKNKSALEVAAGIYQGAYDDLEKRSNCGSVIYTIASYGPDEASVSGARKIAIDKARLFFASMISDGLLKSSQRGIAAPPSAAPAGTASAPQPMGTAKGKALETKLFSASLADNWEVLSNDLDNMGMMTLSRKGTGGSHGIYIKFEGNGAWQGTPEQEAASFAKSQKGTPPAKVTLNGITFVQTTYDAFGTRQNMLVTKKSGNKVTLTIMGDDYTRSAEVKLFFDTLTLK